MTYTPEQFRIGLNLMNRPNPDRLRSAMTPAGPAVTAQLINLGVRLRP